jgi:hypothetical protein
MPAHDPIVRCAACDGYGWIAADADFFGDDPGEAGEADDCTWCAGIGYVYQDERGVARRIPEAELPGVSAELEMLEVIRLREIGYTGEAKPMHEQAVRKKRIIP